MIQPDVLTEIGKARVLRGRGLLGRFLYFFPKSRLGTRNAEPPCVPEKIKKDYEAMIRRLAEIPVTMDMALPLIRLLVEHAIAAYQQIGVGSVDSPPISCAKKILQWCMENNKNEFSERDVSQNFKNSSYKNDIRQGLKLLEERKYIKRIPMNKKRDQDENQARSTA